MSKPCVFFDRDGIVNQSPGPGYVERLEDFHVLPEFLDALRCARKRGYVAVIVTNQRGVGLGIMNRAALDQIHDHLLARMREQGLDILDILVATATTNEDPDRKPNPGMLLKAAERHNLDLGRSWMIGDNEKDVLAGKRAGCRTVLVRDEIKETEADYRVANMGELVEFITKTL